MIKSALLSFVFAASLAAQGPHTPVPSVIPYPLPGPFELLPEQMSVDERAEAHRLSIEVELRETHERLQNFVAAWNDFTAEYSTKHAVNRRKARAVQQAWSHVERLFAH